MSKFLLTVVMSSLLAGFEANAQTVWPNAPAATFYRDCGLTGTAVPLYEGSYDIGYLNARGIGNDQLSSLNVVYGYKVTLYDGSNFSGDTRVYRSYQNCLVDDNFNDRTSAIKVERDDATFPAVLLYNGCNFGGTKTVGLGVGNYDFNAVSNSIGNDALSSLKVLPGYKVTLYYDAGYSGPSRVYTGDKDCLSHDAFDKVTSSLKIEKDPTYQNPPSWGWVRTEPIATFYQACGYDGVNYNYQSLSEGKYTASDLAYRGIGNNQLSSLKVASGYKVTLYDGDNFTGATFTATGDRSCLVDYNFNDLTSSLKVERDDAGFPAIRIYNDCYYGGSINQGLGVGDYDIDFFTDRSIGNDALSSIQILPGYQVTLYADAHFSGNALTFNGDNECLALYGFDKKTSSMKIRRLNTTARVAPEDIGTRMQVAVSPNPATDNLHLHIEGALTGEARILVTNLQGQVMIDVIRSLNEGANELSLERGALPAGMYIMQIVQGTNRISEKIVFN